MQLDPQHCYRALTSRDARFDGSFFVGVVTTGVYCRPICPATAPRETNARYYPCAAAAEEQTACMEEISSSSQELSDMAQHLEDSVHVFKVE